MKKHIIYLLAIICIFLVGAYIFLSPSSSDEKTLDIPTTIVVTTTITPSPTSIMSDVLAEQTRSLRVFRNGKSYEISSGYSAIYISTPSTPQARIPEWQTEWYRSADIKLYGDFDEDGEVEFIVSLYFCGPYCSEEIRIYKYDLIKDDFVVADLFANMAPAVKEYADFNHDGNPEIVTDGNGFCYLCSTVARSALAATQILRYQNGKLEDVTREFPEILEKDANHFLESSDDGNKAFFNLPSYLYDMYRLDKISFARQVFDKVCSSTTKVDMPKFDCNEYRKQIEDFIQLYESSNAYLQSKTAQQSMHWTCGYGAAF